MPPAPQEAPRSKSKTREVGNAIHERIAARFGPEVVECVDAVDPYTVVRDVGAFLDVMMYLRRDEGLRFDFLRSVSGVDWPDENFIESVYHLYSYDHGHAHVVKFRADRANPEVPSVESIWPTANWFERETYDLFGVVYLGHGDLRRIMLPDDWSGHPLRKDWVESDRYHDMTTTRPSPLDAFAAADERRRAALLASGKEPPPPIQSTMVPPEGWVDPKEKKKAKADAGASVEKTSAKPKAPEGGDPS